MGLDRANILNALQADILRMEGYKSIGKPVLDIGLGPLTDVFPNKSFPIGAVHEFLSPLSEDFAATGGFISGLLSAIMRNNGVAVWISACRKIFAPALKCFGVQPDRVIFLDLKNEKDVTWAMEETLKCGALAAVIGEVDEISFTASRRLQLAVENSSVTGFILRRNCRKLTTTACVARWKITSIPGRPIDELPGVGFPRWRVELMRVRNGTGRTMNISWVNGGFEVYPAEKAVRSSEAILDKTG